MTRKHASLFVAFAVAGLSLSTAGAQDVPTRRATQVFRLGGPDAKDPYAFARRPELVVDSARFIYARLPSEARILVLDPDGKFVRHIGREGEGPGEFQLAKGHGFVGDTLWVTNWPTPRTSLFRKDGTHLSTFRSPVDIGRRLSAPAGITGLLAGGRAYTMIEALTLGTDGRDVMPVLVGTRDMKTVDTIATIPNPRGLYISSIGSWSFDPIPSSPIVAVSPNGETLAVAEWDRSRPETVTLRIVNPNGSERLRRQLQLPARPIPARVRDSLLTTALGKARPQLDGARRKGQQLPASNERLVEQGLDLPTHYSPIRTLVLGIDGTIWLERFGEGRTGDWLVLDRTGTPVFRVQLPPTLEVQQASATDVWGTDRDELDVSYLVRMKIGAG
jgi:hypothetical protein